MKEIEFCYRYVMEKHINQMKGHLTEDAWKLMEKNVADDIEEFYESIKGELNELD